MSQRWQHLRTPQLTPSPAPSTPMGHARRKKVPAVNRLATTTDRHFLCLVGRVLRCATPRPELCRGRRRSRTHSLYCIISSPTRVAPTVELMEEQRRGRPLGGGLATVSGRKAALFRILVGNRLLWWHRRALCSRASQGPLRPTGRLHQRGAQVKREVAASRSPLEFAPPRLWFARGVANFFRSCLRLHASGGRAVATGCEIGFQREYLVTSGGVDCLGVGQGNWRFRGIGWRPILTLHALLGSFMARLQRALERRLKKLWKLRFVQVGKETW